MKECSVASGSAAVPSSSRREHTRRMLSSGSTIASGSAAATKGRGMPEMGQTKACGKAGARQEAQEGAR